MTPRPLRSLGPLSFVLFLVPPACSSGMSGGSGSGPGADTSPGSAPGGPAGTTVGAGVGAPGSASGGAEDPSTPAVRFVGRFDATNPASPRTAWPGSRIVARFDGTGVTAKLSQTNGFGGGNSWFNVLVDGTVTKQLEVSGTGQVLDLASGLPPGTHVIELEKRTEANLGTVTFDGFTFAGGSGLLPPPPPAGRRLEFLADSTIDGFGAAGNVSTTCAGGDPAPMNDVHASLAEKLTEVVTAESHILAYSGKGVVLNEGGDTSDTYPAIWGRTLPEVPASAWDFSAFTPDAVIMSLGGTDLSGETLPPGFESAYDGLVTQVRSRYPNAHVYMTVWSQIKDLGPGLDSRTALKAALDGVKAAHASDARLHVYVFPEATFPTDETGCEEHANEAHATAMAVAMAPTLKKDLGW
jgi:hypothetical protein